MKKFLIFLVFLMAFTLTPSDDTFILSRLNLEGVYSCYAQEVKNLPSCFRVDINGSGKIVSCDMLYARDTSKYVNRKVYGESISYKGTYDDFKKMINELDVKVVASDSIGDLECLYGFGDFGRHVMVNGKAVNIQIAYNLGNITIGCPIILGSY